MKKLLLLFSAILLLHFQSFSQTENTVSALDARINGLVSQMSVKEKVEQLYYNTDSSARLGIPRFTGSDGPHGIGNKATGYSCFPVTIAMAASWDTSLILRVGRAISLEQAARKRFRIAGPTLDLLSDPRNGRASETVGEDPFLAGRISEAFIQGQNTTAVFGSIKHYNINTYEANREKNNYTIDQRSLVEFWGAHWKRAVQYGGAMSIMCSYNLVNGDKSAENYNLIKTILRDSWGFNYYTMCDWGGFWSTKKAINAELDFCEGNDLYIKELAGFVTNGSVNEEILNKAVRNVLRTKILSGMMEGQPIVNKNIIDGKANRALVYESGLKSLVLLKNEGDILPLPKKNITVALIGPNAAILPLDGKSSSYVIPSYTISIKNALDSLLGENKVKYVEGCKINDNDKSQFAAAIAAAKTADYVVFAAGLDSTVEGEGYFMGGDRLTGSTRLPGVQNDLINQLAAVNPKLILTVISGGTCSVNKVISNVKGLLYAFYPGQEGGRAIVDVLLGNYNPSGKLPVTIPKDDSQLPATDMDFNNAYLNGFGYRWYDQQKISPEYAFGYGLSYTTFQYSNIRLSPANPKIGDAIYFRFDLKNTGKLSGEEVPQLYLSQLQNNLGLPMPVKELKGFKKISLMPGETQAITFKLMPEELYVFNKTYQVPVGTYQVMIGGGSDRLPLAVKFKLAPAALKPHLIVTNIRTMPAFPKAGDSVTFMVSVLNNGTESTITRQKSSINFYIDGEKVAAYHGNLVIPTGGMQFVCATPLNRKKAWQAGKKIYIIKAVVNGRTNLETNSCEAILNIQNNERAVSKHVYELLEHATLVK